MKLSLLPKLSYFPQHSNRLNSVPDNSMSHPNNINLKPSNSTNCLGTILYCISCLFSLILGFRLSRIIFFLLFSTPTNLSTTTTTTTTTTTATTTTTTTVHTISLNYTQSHIIVGRHGINIRPWPHPNSEEMMQAHAILERVQKEQSMQYGVKDSREIIVVTTTYVRSFQRMYLNGLIHSLMLVPYDLTWVVVEVGGISNETSSILNGSQINFVHVPFTEANMPVEWDERQKMEARMRLHALRVIKERKMDGIVMFADDSNIHSMEVFDEIQRVKWIGTFSIGILNQSKVSFHNKEEVDEMEGVLIPVQGPTCNPSKKLVSLPSKQEWAAFVLNSRLLWNDNEGKQPEWIHKLDDLVINGKEIENPLDFVKDASFVEPIGNCGKKVLLWWLRAEARADS